MRDYEKEISFLNRFFIYKKTSTRNAEQLTKALLDQLPDQENSGTLFAREAVINAEKQIKPKGKKLSEKLKLQDATEAFDEDIILPKKIGEDFVENKEEMFNIIIPVTKKKTTRRKKDTNEKKTNEEK
jgi:hypothetical protein